MCEGFKPFRGYRVGGGETPPPPFLVRNSEKEKIQKEKVEVSPPLVEPVLSFCREFDEPFKPVLIRE